MSDALIVLLRINLAAAAAIALVLALRLPVRRLFGARIAYGLWLLAPAAALAMLAPARVVTLVQPPPPLAREIAGGLQPMDMPTLGHAMGFDPWLLAGGLWIAGALVSLAHLAWRQAQFGRAVREGLAGPAVVGVLRPRIVIPADFDHRYSPRERMVVLAHEQTHIARQDARINAVAALVRCVNWFNPLVHLLARYLRVDQEFACDAQVVAAHPTARRSYAEAMLKAQLAARPLPMGCYWPAPGAHPLAARIRLLAKDGPDAARRRTGAVAVALLTLGAAAGAWAARPVEVVSIPAPSTAASARVVSPAKVDEPATPAAPARTDRATPGPGPEPAPAPVQLASAAENGVQPTAAAPSAEPADGALSPASEDETSLPPRRERKIFAVARQSAVEPGSAVRVLATMTDRDGVPLVTDMTAFGSQSRYRSGYYLRRGSRYALFTAVLQQGDRLWVTASLDRRFRPETSGATVLKSGETGRIVLGDGQVVTVTPIVRPETPEEVEEGLRAQRDGARG